MIPVTLLTGYLGSGKTTLLAGLLKQPGFGRTAVVINEFGEIGLDHELVAASDEQFVELTTGCLCCKVQSDLVVTLEDLLKRRDVAALPAFERVVIETSGLADPAPILHALMITSSLAARLAQATVVATVDCLTGERSLSREAVSVKQVAVADQLILTKTDLTEGVPIGLTARLDAINASAPRAMAVNGAIAPGLLFPAQSPAFATAPMPIRLPAGDRDHNAGIDSFVLWRDRSIPAAALALFLEALAEHAGQDLLRVKGLVAVAEASERPAVIHGVQHVFHPLTWLDRWPSEDKRSRIVFIARGLRHAWVDTLLSAIEAEVAEVGSMH